MKILHITYGFDGGGGGYVIKRDTKGALGTLFYSRGVLLEEVVL